MFVTVVGVPSTATGTVVRVVRNLVKDFAGSHEFVSVRTDAAFRDAALQLKGRHVVFGHESPDGKLVELLAGFGSPLFVVLDDPVAVALQLHRNRGQEFCQAARVVSTCMAVLEIAARQPHAIIIDRRQCAPGQLYQLIADIAGHLRMEPVSSQIMKLAKLLAPSDFDPCAGSVSAEIAALRASNPLDDAIATALVDYRIKPPDTIINRLYWPSAVFNSRHRTIPTTGDETVELAGPPRTLLWGPLLGVPKGHWVARLSFATRESFANRVTIRALSKVCVGEGQFELPREGSHQVALPFTIDEPKTPTEIQIQIVNAAIEGQVKFFGAELTRLSHS